MIKNSDKQLMLKKKLGRAAVLMLALMLAMPATAQVKFGLKGGLDITEMSLNSDVLQTSNRNGFYGGAILRVGFPVSPLGFDISGLYDRRETKINDQKVTQESILVPINLRGEIGLGEKAAIYLALGPQVAFNIGDDNYSWTDFDANREQVTNTFQLKKSNFSINLGAGVRIGSLEVGASYNVAVSRTASLKSFKSTIDEAIDNYKADSNAWQLGVTLYF